MDVFSSSNPVFATYGVCCGILAIKMILMANATGLVRVNKGVFGNPEDVKYFGHGKVKYDDPLVERLRRSLLNDLENIIPFYILSLIYMTTNPSPGLACNLIWLFTISRILHTIVYTIYLVRQPARAITFLIPCLINMFFAIRGIMHYI